MLTWKALQNILPIEKNNFRMIHYNVIILRLKENKRKQCPMFSISTYSVRVCKCVGKDLEG